MGRSGSEWKLAQDVLDGDLDPFMAAALAQAVGGKKTEAIEIWNRRPRRRSTARLRPPVQVVPDA
jgi:hypothetical protein